MAPTVEEYIDSNLRSDVDDPDLSWGIFGVGEDQERLQEDQKECISACYDMYSRIMPSLYFGYAAPAIKTLEQLKQSGIPGMRNWRCDWVHSDIEGKKKFVWLGLSVRSELFERYFPISSHEAQELANVGAEEKDWDPSEGIVQYWGDRYIVALDITKTPLGKEILTHLLIPRALDAAFEKYRRSKKYRDSRD